MKRASSSFDGDSSSSSASYQAVRAFTSEHCPHLDSELELLEAMHPESLKIRLVPNKNNNSNSNNIERKFEKKVVVQQKEEEEEGESENNNNNTNNNNVLRKQQEQQKKSSSSSSSAAVSITIPLQSEIRAGVELQLVLDEPESFSESARSSDFILHVKSASLSPGVRADLAHALKQFNDELADAESVSISSIAGRAEELLLNLPISQQSKTFGLCLNCNKKRSKQGLESVPQPISIKLADGLDSTSEVEAIFSSSADVVESKCLACNSKDGVVLIRSIVPTKNTECSCCLCDDFPLIVINDCHCLMCFDCFLRFSELAIGSKEVKSRSHGLRLVGIQCPNHKTPLSTAPGSASSLINDAALLKLLPTRTLLRFSAFSVKSFAAKAGSFTCENVGNCMMAGFPQLTPTSIFKKEQLACCISCGGGASCLKCKESAVRCKCTELREHELPVKERVASQVRKSDARDLILKNFLNRERRDQLLLPNPHASSSSSSTSSVSSSNSNNQQKKKKNNNNNNNNNNKNIIKNREENENDNEESSSSVSSTPGEFEVTFVLGKFRLTIEVPFHSSTWPDVPRAHLFEPNLPMFRVTQGASAFFIFNGCLLDDKNRTLAEQHVYPNALIFVLPFFENTEEEVFAEYDLWKFRKKTQNPEVSNDESQKFMEKFGKKCPGCSAYIMHFFMHQCHHIKCLCGCEMCFQCGGKFGNCRGKCRVFCQPAIAVDFKTRTVETSCGCNALCPICSPGMSCELCQGNCPSCSTEPPSFWLNKN